MTDLGYANFDELLLPEALRKKATKTSLSGFSLDEAARNTKPGPKPLEPWMQSYMEETFGGDNLVNARMVEDAILQTETEGIDYLSGKEDLATVPGVTPEMAANFVNYRGHRADAYGKQAEVTRPYEPTTFGNILAHTLVPAGQAAETLIQRGVIDPIYYGAQALGVEWKMPDELGGAEISGKRPDWLGPTGVIVKLVGALAGMSPEEQGAYFKSIEESKDLIRRGVGGRLALGAGEMTGEVGSFLLPWTFAGKVFQGGRAVSLGLARTAATGASRALPNAAKFMQATKTRRWFGKFAQTALAGAGGYGAMTWLRDGWDEETSKPREGFDRSLFALEAAAWWPAYELTAAAGAKIAGEVLRRGKVSPKTITDYAKKSGVLPGAEQSADDFFQEASAFWTANGQAKHVLESGVIRGILAQTGASLAEGAGFSALDSHFRDTLAEFVVTGDIQKGQDLLERYLSTSMAMLAMKAGSFRKIPQMQRAEPRPGKEPGTAVQPQDPGDAPRPGPAEPQPLRAEPKLEDPNLHSARRAGFVKRDPSVDVYSREGDEAHWFSARERDGELEVVVSPALAEVTGAPAGTFRGEEAAMALAMVEWATVRDNVRSRWRMPGHEATATGDYFLAPSVPGEPPYLLRHRWGQVTSEPFMNGKQTAADPDLPMLAPPDPAQQQLGETVMADAQAMMGKFPPVIVDTLAEVGQLIRVRSMETDVGVGNAVGLIQSGVIGNALRLTADQPGVQAAVIKELAKAASGAVSPQVALDGILDATGLTPTDLGLQDEGQQLPTEGREVHVQGPAERGRPGEGKESVPAPDAARAEPVVEPAAEGRRDADKGEGPRPDQGGKGPERGPGKAVEQKTLFGGEGGYLSMPNAAEIGRVAHKVAKAADTTAAVWYEPEMLGVKRIGTPHALEVAEKTAKVVDLAKKNLGEANRLLTELQRMTARSPFQGLTETGRARLSANAEVKETFWEGNEGYTLAHILMEPALRKRFSIPDDLAMSEDAKRSIELAKGLVKLQRKWFAAVGATIRTKSGDVEITEDFDRDVFVRHPSPEFVEAMMNGGPVLEQAKKVLAKANDMPVQDASLALEGMMERNFIRRDAIETARTLRFFPDQMRMPDGSVVRLLEGDLYWNATSGTRHAAARAAFLSEFPQDRGAEPETTPEWIRGLGPKAIDIERGKSLMRALNMMPQVRSYLSPGTVPWTMSRGISFVGRVSRVAAMSRSFLPNIPEIYGAPAAFFGMRRVVGAQKDVAVSLTNSLKDSLGMEHGETFMEMFDRLADEGYVTHDIVDYNVREGRRVEDMSRIFGNVGLAPMRLVQEVSEIVTVLAASKMLDDMAQGKGVGAASETLRQLGFGEEEIASLKAGVGAASDKPAIETKEPAHDMRGKVLRRAVAFTMGGTTAQQAERPVLQNNRYYQQMVFADSYFNRRGHHVFEALRRIGNGEAQAKDFHLVLNHAARIPLTALLAGGLTSALLAMWRGGEDEVKQWAREVAADPLPAMADMIASNMVGGASGVIIDAVTGEREWDFETVFGGSLLGMTGMEAYHLYGAIAGEGIYKNFTAFERLGKFMGLYATLARDAGRGIFGVAAFALSDKDPNFERAHSAYWRWMRKNTDVPSFSGWTPTDFTAAMRHAKDLIRRGEAPNGQRVREAVREALKLKDGSAVGKSFLARRYFHGLTRKQEGALNKVLGENAKYLRIHDQLMERLADYWRDK